jgi:uncharacterized protein (DUF1501 family)
MKQSRRKFLRDSACGLTAAAMVSSLDQFSLVNAMVQQQSDVASDYRALVCIFLSGGSDNNNVVIPYTEYFNPTGGTTNGYSNVRAGSQLAIPQADLLQITPPNTGGLVFGLHPNLSPEAFNPGQPNGLLGVWNQGKLAILNNVGTLVQQLTRAQYLAGQPKPYQLFSHSDQVTQQQTSVSNTVSQTGWGGRVADIAGGLNGAVALPMNISVGGTTLFATGITSRQLAISSTGTLANLLVLNWSGPGTANPNTAGSSYRQLLGLDLQSFLVKGASDTSSQALTADAALNQSEPTVGVFPATSLGNQLKQVAKLIKVRDAVGITMKRQIFFCQIGGFDNHTNETGSNPTSPAGGGANSGNQGSLLTQLSQAMRAFYDEMVAQGVSNNVTTFTMSDFGRTLQPSGSGATTVGSDHAWGSHALIMGGSVLGGTFYGSLRPDGTGVPYGYPTLALGGPDDTDNRGRWIPTTSIDQYAATLAKWYGLAPAEIPIVFPNLFKFAPQNLGFLAP